MLSKLGFCWHHPYCRRLSASMCLACETYLVTLPKPCHLPCAKDFCVIFGCQSLSPQPTRRAFPYHFYPEFSLVHGQLMSFALDCGTRCSSKRILLPPTVLPLQAEKACQNACHRPVPFQRRNYQFYGDALLASLRSLLFSGTPPAMRAAFSLPCIARFGKKGSQEL